MMWLSGVRSSCFRLADMSAVEPERGRPCPRVGGPEPRFERTKLSALLTNSRLANSRERGQVKRRKMRPRACGADLPTFPLSHLRESSWRGRRMAQQRLDLAEQPGQLDGLCVVVIAAGFLGLLLVPLHGV